jgi:nucleotide-binding universal stress UspA family protein
MITGRQSGDRKEVFMERIRTILAPTDLSKLSQVGVRYALELAKIQGAEVIVYHVANYKEAIPFQELNSPHVKSVEEFRDDRKKEVDHFLRGAFPELISKVKIRQEVGVGTPHERIVERAEKKDVDMIVMSTHGRTALAHMFIGSVTEQVVRRSVCPVLSVRPQAAATPA